MTAVTAIIIKITLVTIITFYNSVDYRKWKHCHITFGLSIDCL